jgi:hypothetical protein
MPAGAGKSKCTFRRIVAPEPISASEVEAAERILARLVARAYAAEHPDLFASGTAKVETAESSPGHTSRTDGPALACSEVH